MIYENRLSEILPNGNTINYKVYNGTAYHEQTCDEVVKWLETSRERSQRIRIFYGDTKTGKCWNDEYDTIGRVGRSTGRIKIPLLIKNARSHGGTGILDHCIIRITVDKHIVYSHKDFHVGKIELKEASQELTEYGYNQSVFIDGKNVANFERKEKAEKWIKFIKGESNAK